MKAWELGCRVETGGKELREDRCGCKYVYRYGRHRWDNSHWMPSFFPGKYGEKSSTEDAGGKCGIGDLRKEVNYKTATVRSARMSGQEKYSAVAIQCRESRGDW